MKKIVYWLLPLGWMGMIYYSSSTPYEDQDIKPFMGNFFDLSFLEPYLDWISFTYNKSVVSVTEIGVDGFIEFFIRKGAHFFVFFVLTLLFYVAFKMSTKIQRKYALLYSVFLSLAYAITDEFHQGFTPNRTPYIGDVIIDGMGAIFAIFCIIVISRLKQINEINNNFIE